MVLAGHLLSYNAFFENTYIPSLFRCVLTHNALLLPFFLRFLVT